MTWSVETSKRVKALKAAADDTRRRFSGRDVVVDLMTLAVICQEHLLLIGPPGTAKSEIISRFARLCDARHFQYLLTRFTEPAELFGPVDIKAFQAGEYKVNTNNMLPQAHFAFLDEIFQGSSAILNTLLTLLHERAFFNGADRQPAALMSLLAASNDLPGDATLRAFSDRFLLRVVVEPVPDEQLSELVTMGWALEVERMERGNPHTLPFLHPDDVDALTRQLPRVDLGPVRGQFEEIIRQSRSEAVDLSDRRVVKAQKLVAAAAMLSGRDRAEASDLWPLRHIWTGLGEAAALQAIVDAQIAEAGGEVGRARRPLEALVDELNDLVAEEDHLRTDVAVSAQLKRLGRLRQELVADHGGAQALRGQIDLAVKRLLARLEV
jgi:MoxR-like ATPase